MNDASRDDRHRGPSDADLDRAAPRDRGSRELRVGIFVLVGLISFVVVLFLLTDPATLRGRYMLVTEMENAGGVRRGDPIQMRGVNIGRVHGFEMLPSGQVDISLEIEGEWQIREGSVARLGEVGLFGGRTLEIVPGSSERYLEPGDTIPGQGAGSNLFETVGDVGTEASQVLNRINALLDDPTVGAVQGTAVELRQLVEELRAIARVQRQELQVLTGTLNRAAGGIEDASAAGATVASAAARADSALLTLNRTSATLDDAAASLDVVMERIAAGEGTLGRLSRDDTLYVNLTRAAEAIALLAEDIRANPGRYVRIEIF